ncbi:proteasome activator [Intrasporangium sp.]|uniref:proteasome activator n=1 Tax=Intrasporangium sp. TaxID=1925024 RepID=UPI00293958EE|nr:proteasome activator [Intrasporangium sp.]MDV3223409.1 bacterial proteasome activator family protein [Intrasporangium sp.]
MSDDARQPDSGQDPRHDAPRDDQRIVVLTPDGMGVADAPGSGPSGAPGGGDGDDDRPERGRTNPADLVEEPAKVMRIGSMIKQLLDEVRSAPLDPAGRRRLAEIHHQSIEELKDGLSPELVDELERIAHPFREESPSDPELRIAQAQLVGWLEGLFHGIQTALVAQQMAAQQQLAQMRALPAPPGAPGVSYGTPPGAGHGHLHQPEGPTPGGREPGPTGQYL